MGGGDGKERVGRQVGMAREGGQVGRGGSTDGKEIRRGRGGVG